MKRKIGVWRTMHLRQLIRARTRRLRRKNKSTRHSKSTRHGHRMRGGNYNTIPMTVTGGTTGGVINSMNAGAADQSAANRSLRGGSGGSSISGSSIGGSSIGGSSIGGSSSSDGYGYATPAGMVGPIPQTAVADANKLIIMAAKLDSQQQENSKYDHRSK